MKKIIKYLFLGVCLLTLLVGINQSALMKTTAQEVSDGTTDTTYVSYPNLGDGTTDTTYVDYPPIGDGTTDTTYVSYPGAGDGTTDTTYVSYPGAGDGTTDTTFVSYPSAPSGPSYPSNPSYPAGPSYPVAGPSCSGGDWQFIYPECDWGSGMVRDVYQDSCGNYSYQNYHVQPGACGAPEAQQPTSVSAGQVPPSQPVIVNVPQQPTPIMQQQQQQEQQAPVIFQQPAFIQQTPVTTVTNTNTNTNNNVNNISNNNSNSSSSSSSSNATVTNAAPVQPQSGGTQEIRVVTANQPVVIQTASQPVAQPQVVQVAGQSVTKELPKTGLPLLAWGAAAFLPTGLRFRKFGKNSSEVITPNYLWEQRQFKI